MKEKTKVLAHRYSWLAIIFLIIFLPIIINACQPPLNIVDDNVYIDYYYSSINQTTIGVEITFNRPVNSGYVTIDFYDENNNFLETKRIRLSAYDETIAENTYTSVYGKVDKYEILAFEFDIPFILDWLYYFLYPAIIMFIGALFVQYREYEYNGKRISVYAGYFHHTLRINEEKFDEHNTFLAFTPIKLSTKLDEKTNIEATITLSNRVSLKINNKLLNRIKKNNKFTSLFKKLFNKKSKF